MIRKKLNILSINQSDQRGGAAAVAWNLFNGYIQRGHQSSLVVDYKFSDHPNVIKVENPLHYNSWTRWVRSIQSQIRKAYVYKKGAWRLLEMLDWVANPAIKFRNKYGIEEFNFPGSRNIFNSTTKKPDLIHTHNLHGGYFDLRLLATLSQTFPVFLTLHDAWMLSGHCAHSFECERWKTGCGNCPDLTIPKAIKYDNSALNWKRKHEIYKKSKLYISTPCQWLMDKVNASILREGCVESKVIPYGIDHSIFFPSDSLISRQNLGIEHDSTVLLFSANGIKRNRWKDFAMMKKALEKIGSYSWSKKIVFLALGEQAPSEFFGQVELRFVPYRSDKKSVADFYRAADIYLHAAKADTFPNAVLEALSCGTPVLGTAVGGIPEQVKGYDKFLDENACNRYPEDKATGILSSSGDVESFVEMLVFLIENDSTRKKMGFNAAIDAKVRFPIERQVSDYLDWYQSVLRNKTE